MQFLWHRLRKRTVHFSFYALHLQDFKNFLYILFAFFNLSLFVRFFFHFMVFKWFCLGNFQRLSLKSSMYQLSLCPTTVALRFIRNSRIKSTILALICLERGHLTLLFDFFNRRVLFSDGLSTKSAFEYIHIDFDAVRHAITDTSSTPNWNPLGKSEVYSLCDIET